MKKIAIVFWLLIFSAFLPDYAGADHEHGGFLGNNCAVGLCYGWANDLDQLRRSGVPGVRPYPSTRDVPMGGDGAWVDPRVQPNPRFRPRSGPGFNPQGWPAPPPRQHWRRR